MARNGRSSPPRGRRWGRRMLDRCRSSPPWGRRWLGMAARARPGAADGAAHGSKLPLEPAPELQNTRQVPLEPALEPQNARRAPLEPPRNRRMLDGCRSSREPQNARRRPLEPALEQQHARKVPLEPTAVRCVRFLRSKNVAPCSSFIGIIFCSAPPCFVHVMHGFTLVYIYIYI